MLFLSLSLSLGVSQPATAGSNQCQALFTVSRLAVTDLKITELLKENLIQEAIWEASARGYHETASQLRTELEHAIRAGEILRIEPLSGSMSESYFVAFKSGISGVFKPHSRFWTRVDKGQAWIANVHAEVDAYRIDRLIGLDQVPMTLEVSLQSMTGSLQVFVSGEKAADLDYVDYTHPTYKTMRILDYLLRNGDRHSRNFLLLGGKFVAIDNGNAFLPLVGGRGSRFTSLNDLDLDNSVRPILVAIKTKMTPETLRALLKDRHPAQVIQEIIDRRAQLLARVPEL